MNCYSHNVFYRWVEINTPMMIFFFCKWNDISVICFADELIFWWYMICFADKLIISLLIYDNYFSRWIDVEWKGGPGTVRSLVRIGEWMPPIGHIMAFHKGWNPRAKSWGVGTLAVISNKDPVKINNGPGPPPPAWMRTLR